MLITDRLEITDKRRTTDGYLVTEARFARNGIYEYAGSEVGKPSMDKVIVYRPDDEVFDQDAMASFAHKPITNDHPSHNVTAKTWKRDAVGFSDGRVARDGDFVVVPLMVTDQKSIDDVDAGKVELSAGYTCDLDFVDGLAPNGQKYDAVMRNIRGNHIALVDRGRAGSECRIGDSFGDGEIEMNVKKIMVDGLQVETTDAGEAAIVKLQGQIADRDRSLAAAESDRDAKLADKDKELAAKDAEIADLKTKVIDAAALDAKVAERAILVDRATKLVPAFDAKGKSDAEIKRAVVLAKCGDAAVTDKSDVYIDARFDTLVDTLGTNPGTGPDAFRDQIMRPTGTGNVVQINPADAAADAERALAEASDLNAWRTPKSA